MQSKVHTILIKGQEESQDEISQIWRFREIEPNEIPESASCLDSTKGSPSELNLPKESTATGLASALERAAGPRYSVNSDELLNNEAQKQKDSPLDLMIKNLESVYEAEFGNDL